VRTESAIIAPAIDLDQVSREILREHIALQDAERKLKAMEIKTDEQRQACERRRLEIGRMLAAVRPSIKRGGWYAFIEKLAIGADSAERWMRLAGYVEEITRTEGDVRVNEARVPTLRDAGIDKRPRKSEVRNDEQPDREPVRQSGAPALDIDSELLGIHQKIMAHAKTWPATARLALAHELRAMAELIEEMNDE
jgi:hypothetical protein